MKAALESHFKAAVSAVTKKLTLHNDDDFGELGRGKECSKFIIQMGDVDTTQEGTHFEDSFDVTISFHHKGRLEGIDLAQQIRKEAIKLALPQPLSTIESLGISGVEKHDKLNLINLRFNLTANLSR